MRLSVALLGLSVQIAVLEAPAVDRDLLVSAQTGSGKTVAFGLALAFFALAPDFLTATVLMLFVGAASNIYMALNNTMIMANCDSRMHGRVMSVYMMAFSMMPLATMPRMTI